MKSRSLLRRPDTRRGAVSVLVAVSLTLLVGVMALSVESGRMYDLRRRTQSASDTAALAAATSMYRTAMDTEGVLEEQDPGVIAREVARLNGFNSDTMNQVVVSIPPRSGAFAGREGFVQVEIEARLKRTFSAVFGKENLTVRTSSVAGGTILPTSASLLVLEPKKDKALKLKGEDTRLTTEGDIFVNSTSKKAVQLDKKAQLSADTIVVSGGMDRKSKGFFEGDLLTGAEPTPDPYADLPTPPKGPELDPKKYLTVENGQNVYRLPPGTYKELKAEHNDLIILSPGVFYIESKFDIKGESSLIGHGVTIYSAKEGMKFNTKGSVDLTPPTSGPYEDITLFMNPDSKKKVQFKKDASYELQGVIYAPNSEVKFQHTDAILSGSDSDDEEDDQDYGGPETTGVLHASIIAKKLSIDKHSTVQLLGADIEARRPFLGVIE